MSLRDIADDGAGSFAEFCRESIALVARKRVADAIDLYAQFERPLPNQQVAKSPNSS
jgi:hypothetical protein